MTAQFSRVVIQRTSPYEEVLGKQPEPPLLSQAHNHNQNVEHRIIIVSHHVH
jgi:lantibiotic modifying enzyme